MQSYSRGGDAGASAAKDETPTAPGGGDEPAASPNHVSASGSDSPSLPPSHSSAIESLFSEEEDAAATQTQRPFIMTDDDGSSILVSHRDGKKLRLPARDTWAVVRVNVEGIEDYMLDCTSRPGVWTKRFVRKALSSDRAVGLDQPFPDPPLAKIIDPKAPEQSQMNKEEQDRRAKEKELEDQQKAAEQAKAEQEKKDKEEQDRRAKEKELEDQQKAAEQAKAEQEKKDNEKAAEQAKAEQEKKDKEEQDRRAKEKELEDQQKAAEQAKAEQEKKDKDEQDRRQKEEEQKMKKKQDQEKEKTDKKKAADSKAKSDRSEKDKAKAAAGSRKIVDS